jgi:hypothetical protein
VHACARLQSSLAHRQLLGGGGNGAHLQVHARTNCRACRCGLGAEGWPLLLRRISISEQRRKKGTCSTLTAQIFSLDLETFGPYSLDYTPNGRYVARVTGLCQSSRLSLLIVLTRSADTCSSGGAAGMWRPLTGKQRSYTARCSCARLSAMSNGCTTTSSLLSPSAGGLALRLCVCLARECYHIQRPPSSDLLQSCSLPLQSHSQLRVHLRQHGHRDPPASGPRRPLKAGVSSPSLSPCLCGQRRPPQIPGAAHTHIYIYVYIYISIHTNTHTHTHLHTYMQTYIHVQSLTTRRTYPQARWSLTCARGWGPAVS